MNPVYPHQDADTEDTTARWVIVTLVAIPTALTAFIMLGFLGGGVGAAGLQFPSMLVDNTPTGGDLGAHVLMPEIIRDVLLPSGLISGWSDAWFAGFPAMYFYFPVPMLSAVVLGYVIPPGIALKIVLSAGVVALPTVTFWFVRWTGFPRIVAAVAASGGMAFVFMESYRLFGGNIKSTLVGEFSFSWSLALGVLYLGLVAREIRDPGKFTVWPGVVLALATLSHVVTAIVVVAVTVPWLFRRQTARTVGGSWALAFALTAFWSVPFAIGVFDGMVTDLRWVPVTGLIGPDGLIPAELLPALMLGAWGLAWCAVHRWKIGILVGLLAVPLIGYLVLPRLGIHIVNNGRVLPYWYYGVFVLAGIAVGLGIGLLAERRPDAEAAMDRYSIVVVVLLALLSVASIDTVIHLVEWDFSGYEGKTEFDGYAGLMRAVDDLPPGRVAWEESREEIGRYGSELALMLLPYWSPEHPSMAGLHHESSLTTPFNMINAAEIGLESSRRMEGLRYHAMDFDRGVAHLGVYGVSYYISITPEAKAAALAADLEPLAVGSPWTVFKLPPRDLVEVATFVPSVWTGETGFLDASLLWYDDIDHLDRWLVDDGPAEWPRVSSLEDRVSLASKIESSGTVSDLVVDNGRISFSTTAVGVPHIVKVSYFPNWAVDGAAGPYRAAPSVMVVVPTSENVELEFSRGSAEYAGIGLTGFTLVALVGWGVITYRRRRSEAIDR